MRTSIYLAVAFAILFISLSDAAVYKKQSGKDTPSGSDLAKSGNNGMKARRDILQHRRVHHYRKGNVMSDATNTDVGGIARDIFGGRRSGFLRDGLSFYSG